LRLTGSSPVFANIDFQIEPEATALADLAFDFDPASQQADDAAADAEAEAGSACAALLVPDLLEGLEYDRQLIGLNSRAGVAHFKPQPGRFAA
jgi:hypothetical protein